jgi:hypothetical protein
MEPLSVGISKRFNSRGDYRQRLHAAKNCCSTYVEVGATNETCDILVKVAAVVLAGCVERLGHYV